MSERENSKGDFSLSDNKEKQALNGSTGQNHHSGQQQVKVERFTSMGEPPHTRPCIHDHGFLLLANITILQWRFNGKA